MMNSSEWYDVIDRTTGSREIVFSSKFLEVATKQAEYLSIEGKQVYINKMTIDMQGMLKMEVIDTWGGYVPYTVKMGDE